MNKQILRLADDGYSTVMKILDFLTINLTLSLVLEFLGKEETIVDFVAAFIISILFLLSGEYTGLYRQKLRHKIRKTTKKFLFTMLATMVLFELIKIPLLHLRGLEITNLFPSLRYSWFFACMLLIYAYRPVAFWLAITFNKAMGNKRHVAILGMTPAGLAIEKEILREYSQFNTSVVFYDERKENRLGYPFKSEHKGDINDLMQDIHNGNIDAVYIALPMVARDRIQNYLSQLSDSTVETYIVPDLYTYNLGNSQINAVGHVHTFSVFASPFEGLGAFIKRVEDIVIGSAITLMISPVLIAVAIGVRMSSPGPVLFKQDRYGLGGKKIKVWKFRSMKVMENSEKVTQATKNDPRVTRFGAFIRRTSLDELPQFFNVIQGTMSIVGPRPHAVAHNEEYREIVDNYMIRHKIKPGITGWAQINGYRGETDTVDKMEKRVEYDILYLQNWTLWLDIKIIFLTVFKGFVSEQAY